LHRILATLNSARFADCIPYTAWARLLDEGTYLASVRTFYRVRGDRGLIARAAQSTSASGAPQAELQATAPNQVWSWDITRLRSTMKWQYFCLYVLLIVEMTSMMSAAAGESTWGNSNGRFGSIHPPGDAGVEPYYEPIRAQISGADRVELVLVAR
jgi:hypothetical protein